MHEPMGDIFFSLKPPQAQMWRGSDKLPRKRFRPGMGYAESSPKPALVPSPSALFSPPVTLWAVRANGACPLAETVSCWG